jgi:hypothetical protein
MSKSKLLGGVALLALATQALAVPILPGMSANAVSEPDPIGGAIIAGPLVTPLVSGAFTGTLRSTVIAGAVNPLGGLTFVYEISNGPNSPDPINRITVDSYNGFLTDMSYQPVVGNVAPTLMDRSGSGDVVGYSFVPPPLGIGSLVPGTSSMLLVVQTNAPDFRTALASVIDGGVASGASYGPVPEPATSLLLLLAGSVVLGFRRRG